MIACTNTADISFLNTSLAASMPFTSPARAAFCAEMNAFWIAELAWLESHVTLVPYSLARFIVTVHLWAGKRAPSARFQRFPRVRWRGKRPLSARVGLATPAWGWRRGGAAHRPVSGLPPTNRAQALSMSAGAPDASLVLPSLRPSSCVRAGV